MDDLSTITLKTKLAKKLYGVLNKYTNEIKTNDIELFDMQEIFSEQLNEFYSSINAEKIKNQFESIKFQIIILSN